MNKIIICLAATVMLLQSCLAETTPAPATITEPVLPDAPLERASLFKKFSNLDSVAIQHIGNKYSIQYIIDMSQSPTPQQVTCDRMEKLKNEALSFIYAKRPLDSCLEKFTITVKYSDANASYVYPYESLVDEWGNECFGRQTPQPTLLGGSFF